MPVIDADAHVEESAACWQYLPERLRPRRPMPVTFPLDTDYGEWNAVWVIDNKVRHNAASPTTMAVAAKKGAEIGAQELTDLPGRLADLDRLGVTVQVLYPSLFLGNVAEDVELEGALCASYNSFLANACAQGEGRLAYAAVVAWRNPNAAAEEIDRVARLGGCVAVMARGMEWDQPLDHPRFEPIHAAIDRNNLTLSVHVGFGSPTIRALYDTVPRQPHELGRPRATHGSRLIGGFLSMHAFERLMRSDLADRYPRMRLLWLEIGCDWLPNALRTLGPAARERVERLLGSRLFFSCDPAEDLDYLTGWVGDRCLVAGSDYPHDDASRHESLEAAFRDGSGLSGVSIERILWENPSRCYQL
ncbi:MAG: amidohydrolase family protein [Dehalococcoidia bacterium]